MGGKGKLAPLLQSLSIIGRTNGSNISNCNNIFIIAREDNGCHSYADVNPDINSCLLGGIIGMEM